ncbi:hypothetical protein BU17DRAFT_76995 [Hysterangium stoloniferum]|nr:hypothetical protein BU17DRAFT_76995 [Hysterangium stoloniferum]
MSVDSSRAWALEKLGEIHAQLLGRQLSTTVAEHTTVSLYTRRLYTDARLIHSLVDLRDPDLGNDIEKWKQAVARLDMAIVVAGAAGGGRLDDIFDTIERIQTLYLPWMDRCVPFNVPSPTSQPLEIQDLAANAIPRIAPPSLTNFLSQSCSPFILSGFINDWPALREHPWGSPEYLMRVAGRGRIVPVEIGGDYRTADWKQSMLPWEEFLAGIGMLSEPSDASNGHPAENPHHGILYLAQHSLLTQFPALRSDIIIPDYVYSSPLPPSSFPNYRPPENDEQVVINAWLGPRGTVSPAHTDPYFNCYGQVVGRKTVWLAPPDLQHGMYSFSDSSAPHAARTFSASDHAPVETPAVTTTMLSNTSRVDVFSANTTDFPAFESVVRPSALCAVIEPGDLLYIPPGWWHAMRSEDISFSVSMWF